ncbi:MAG TPA: hypothetical protein VN493_21310 [Thermoanaerobaculia bacterium]|nr:hypothetical protein [Thermoanaerobaculia bacterium]
MKECFVTHGDARYLPLTEVLVRGLAHFSSRPVMVFGVNAEVGYDAPNLIKRTIHLSATELYSAKFRVILESGIESGVYLDADNVPNRGVDDLFAACSEVADYPLLPRHPQELGHLVEELKTELGVERQTMPYAQSCCFVFSRRCQAFLEDCQRISGDLASRSPGAPVLDEPVANVLLWRRNAVRQLPSCNIPKRYYPLYQDGTYESDADFQSCYGGHPFRFHTFHFCKDPERSRHMLAELIERDCQARP